MHRALSSGILLLLLAGPPVGADDPKSKASAADRLAELQKAHKAARAKFSKDREATDDTPEGQKKCGELWKAFVKGLADRVLAAVDLAKADPKSADALTALEWVLTIPRAYYVPAGKLAMELVTEHHAANPKVGKIVA